MGERKKDALRLDFDGQIRLEFHRANVTSDAGLLAYRELDEALGLTAMVDGLELQDPRTGQNTRHSLKALLRQSVYSRLAGYEDTNDAERLCVDPAIRRVVGGRATEKIAASTSQVGRFETEVLADPENLVEIMDLSGRWIDQVRQRKPLSEIILDMDSSVSPTHGHYECTCYHPLFCFNQFGDLEGALLRKGQVHSADAIIDTTPAWKPVVEAMKNLAPGGRLVINAIRKESGDQDYLQNLNYHEDLWMEKEIKSVANITADDIRNFLPIAAKFPIRPTVEIYDLEDANKAIIDLKRGPVRGAKVLRISQS